MFENRSHEHSNQLPIIDLKNIFTFCQKNSFVNPAPDVDVCVCVL